MLAEPDDERKSVRDLLLRRRRARVPWVYLVYHRHAPATGWSDRSVLTPQKRRHVKRRGEIGVEFHESAGSSVR